MKTKFKMIFLGTLAVLAGSPAVRAGEEEGAAGQRQERAAKMRQMRDERLQRLDETLHLTPEQKTKISAIWDKAADEAREFRGDDRVSRRELRKNRKERRELMQDTRQEVRAVLTPEQQKAFDEMPRPKREPAAKAR